MATISELNVRLGLLYKDFDSSLKKVERDLERSGRKFSQLGNDLALSISLPLAALGASAIKQAGEIESLKLAMVSTFAGAGRSAADATKEVEALRQAAMAPGLDFEQAVRGSVRLQNVGFSAEQSRETLVQLANAIALTGGTAQELDGVTRQFAQIVSKGRILQEDITILSENMPKISSLMKDAFGTANVEQLRKMGVTGEEFVQKITAAAAVLPRVEGGIKNALVNAAAEARNSLATLGETIVNTFDVKGKLDTFTKALQSAVSWFASLSDATKSAIIQAGLFLVALGPAVKVMGALYGASAQVVSIFGALAKSTQGLALFFGGMTQSTKSLTEYIKGFGTAMLGVEGAAVRMRVAVIAATAGLATIVLGIAAAVYLMSERFDAAAFAAKTFEDAGKGVRQEAAAEIGVLNKNIDALKDVRTSTEDRKKAADALLSAYPDYLSGINLEKASLAQLNKVQKDLNLSILQGVAERKKAQAVNTIYEKQADILLRIQEIQRSGSVTAGEATLINTGDMIRAGGTAQAVILKLQQQVKDLGTQANITAQDFDKAFKLQSRAIDPLLEGEYKARAAAEEARDAFLGFGDAVATSTTTTKTQSKESEDAAKKMADAYKSVIASIEAVNKKQAVLGTVDFVGEKTDEIERGVEKLIEAGFKPDSEPIQKLNGYLKSIREEIGKGFSGQNETQVKFGMNAGPLPSIPSLSIPDQVLDVKAKLVFPQGMDAFDVPEQVIRLNSGPAMEAVKALTSLQSAAIADISAQQQIAADQNIAAGERERVMAMTNGMSIKKQIDALKQQKLTAISEIEKRQIDAQMAELERVDQEKKAKQQAQMAVLDAVANLASSLAALNQATAEREKSDLDEAYAAKLESVKGNADATAKIQAELAARKAAIDKKAAKESQKYALIGAIINTAQAVTQALASAPFPYSLILAGLAAAAGAVQIATIKQQKFAKGGVITSPTVGLMGEYPGARNNPEIVTPERLMRSVFREESGGGKTQVYGVIRGSDILLSSERAANERGRTR